MPQLIDLPINRLDDSAAADVLTRCCGAKHWVAHMLAARPFQSHGALLEIAEAFWWQLDPADWREAFEQHPKIGDIASLRSKYANTKAWASTEQSGVADASEQILTALALGNARYEARFGYIFIVCATGQSAATMLEMLQLRLTNEPAEEIQIAAGEQLKITKLRLGKLNE